MADHQNLIQLKIIISFALLGAFLIAGSYLTLHLSVDSTFQQIESEQSTKDLNDVERAIDHKINTLASYNKDFAWWDETYALMADRSTLAEYEERYLSFKQWPDIDQEVDGMLMFDTDGTFVVGRLFEHMQEEELSLQTTILNELESRYSAFIRNIAEPDLATQISGFIDTPEGLALVVSGPILTSDYDGESRGRFLTVHFVTPERIQAIGHRSRVELEFIPGAPAQASNHSSASTDNYILNQIPLLDTAETTLATIQVRTPKDISLTGSRSIRNAMIFLTIAIVVATILTWAALHHLMVLPLLSLKAHVASMRKSGDLASSYNAKQQDEVGTLANEIDFLAKRLHASQTQLTIALDDAQSSSRAKSDFLATISHELRTPLNGIIGMTDILLLSKLNEKQQGFAEIVMSSGQNLLKLIDDILDFSKMSSDDTKIIKAEFSLSSLLTEVNTIASEKAEKKGIDYEFVPDNTLPDHFSADRARIKQVLNNLLDNAIKFTSKGQVTLSVTGIGSVTTENQSSVDLQFIIGDTGVGIEQKNLTGIFELFSQADNSSTREYGGTGLGLSASKDLSKKMGGGIAVSSVFGEGSQFSFTVPVEVAEATERLQA